MPHTRPSHPLAHQSYGLQHMGCGTRLARSCCVRDCRAAHGAPAPGGEALPEPATRHSPSLHSLRRREPTVSPSRRGDGGQALAEPAVCGATAQARALRAAPRPAPPPPCRSRPQTRYEGMEGVFFWCAATGHVTASSDGSRDGLKRFSCEPAHWQARLVRGPLFRVWWAGLYFGFGGRAAGLYFGTRPQPRRGPRHGHVWGL